MRCPHTIRLLTVVAATLMLFCSLSLRSYAAACDCSVNVTKTLNICVGGTNYSITVDMCESNFAAPYSPGHCSTLGMNRISKIRKICFNGLIPPGTNNDIISALYCAIYNSDCTTNIWGFSLSLVPGSTYCWQLQAPKCTTRDVNNCIVPCGNSCYWCYYEIRWMRGVGNCTVTNTGSCSDSGQCDQDCEDDCPEPACCQ